MALTQSLVVHDEAPDAGDLAGRLGEDVRETASDLVLLNQRLQGQPNELRASQMRLMVGRMTQGVCHDFNNLLAVIMGSADELMFTTEEPGHSAAEAIMRAAETAAGITRQLAALSESRKSKPEIVSVNAAIERLTRLMKTTLSQSILLTNDLRPEAGNVRADPGQIDQIFLNLLFHARDSMPRGGRLQISTAKVEGAERIRIAISHCRVKTTEQVPSGMRGGLGQAIVSEIVKELGGEFSVHNIDGEGGRCELLLPRVN